MLTLVVEDGTGLATANTYCSLETATAYFESRLNSAEWLDQWNDEQKNVALVHATRVLDEQIEWKGSKSNPTVQALEWPRFGVYAPTGAGVDFDSLWGLVGINIPIASNIIPAWLANATAEMAFRLLEKDRMKLVEDQRITSRSNAGKSETRGSSDGVHLAILPASVISIVQRFTRGNDYRVMRG